MFWILTAIIALALFAAFVVHRRRARVELAVQLGHGLRRGDGPMRLSNSAGSLPPGLDPNADYYVVKVDADRIKLGIR